MNPLLSLISLCLVCGQAQPEAKLDTTKKKQEAVTERTKWLVQHSQGLDAKKTKDLHDKTLVTLGKLSLRVAVVIEAALGKDALISPSEGLGPYSEYVITQASISQYLRQLLKNKSEGFKKLERHEKFLVIRLTTVHEYLRRIEAQLGSRSPLRGTEKETDELKEITDNCEAHIRDLERFLRTNQKSFEKKKEGSKE